MIRIRVLVFITFLLASGECLGVHSIARRWNEALLQAIRNDFARPTVHARNLFHISAGMYDTWVVYGRNGSTYFLGNQHRAYYFPFEEIAPPENVKAAVEEAISYYCYRMIRFRFRNSPGWEETYQRIDDLMDELGFDRQFTGESYTKDGPAAFGNYLAARVIEFGLQDGSNEGGSYQNLEYAPVNEPMVLRNPVIPEIADPNRWQPLAFDTFVDQNGNVMTAGTPPFLSPEWGRVIPFSLQEEDLKVYQVNGMECWVYHDPGEPFYLNAENDAISAAFKRNFAVGPGLTYFFVARPIKAPIKGPSSLFKKGKVASSSTLFHTLSKRDYSFIVPIPSFVFIRIFVETNQGVFPNIPGDISFFRRVSNNL